MTNCRVSAEDGNGAASTQTATTHRIPQKLNATPMQREVRNGQSCNLMFVSVSIALDASRGSSKPHAETSLCLQVRQHFYADAVNAMRAALGAGRTRIRLRCIIPELNVETDGVGCFPIRIAPL
jgi:hypothetical protein